MPTMCSSATCSRVKSQSHTPSANGRTFPLEYIFKSFGAYFIRRKFREPLYHTVLERYVQLITRNGVTQGIFPEGGLSRDGKLRPPSSGCSTISAARSPIPHSIATSGSCPSR